VILGEKATTRWKKKSDRKGEAAVSFECANVYVFFGSLVCLLFRSVRAASETKK
jgi:flagellar biosynthesis protein FlhB